MFTVIKTTGVRIVKYAVAFLIACILSGASFFASPVSAQVAPPIKRTVFAIGNITPLIIPFPLVAHVLIDDQLYHAQTWFSASRASGPVGLAVDEANKRLFVSYESAQTLNAFNAEDATEQGNIRLAGTSNLAGMVVHQERGHLFVVDRGQPTVYVFDTQNFEAVEQWIIPGTPGPWGIDLEGDLLWVANTTETVRSFNIDTHELVDQFTQTNPAIAIAVTDYPERYVFTTAWDGGTPTSPGLTKYAVDTDVEDFATLPGVGKGVSLNPAINQVYVIVSNNLAIYDMETLAPLYTYLLGNLWSSTDCLASEVRFTGTVKKECISHPAGQIIIPGDEVVFEITVQNRHSEPIHVLPLEDQYDTGHLAFVSATPVSDDAIDDGVINWSDLVVSFGQDQDPGETFTVEVVFNATATECTEFVEGSNLGEISGLVDTEGETLDDAAGSADYRINCYCREDEDCDDGLFCNGLEYCNELAQCVSPGNPCPLDDEVFCNGQETVICDEDLDECGHTGDPCVDDGNFCNGDETCNEQTQQCEHNGDPCVDDGIFCNGDDYCDPTKLECQHTGDPCEEYEICDEDAELCVGDNVPIGDDDDAGWPEGKVTGGCCGCE